MYNSLLTEISLIMMKGSDSDFPSLEYNRCHRFLQKNNQNLFCCKTGTRKWKINAKLKKKKKIHQSYWCFKQNENYLPGLPLHEIHDTSR